MDSKPTKNRLTKISVSGADPILWDKLKSKLLLILDKSLDTIINYDTGGTIKDEAREFTTALIEFGKEKLKKASIENEKLNAEIEEIYTRIKKEKAETRKINAIADKINLDNQLRAIRISLGSAKALLIGSEENEDILFIKRVDTFLEVINDMKHSDEIT